MAINFQLDKVKCWRTGYYSNVYRFLRKLGYDHKDAAEIKAPTYVKRVIDSELTLPEDYRRLTEKGSFAARCRKYLENRDFDIDYLDYLGLGYSISEGSIIIPFLKGGVLTYYTGRTIVGNGLKYKNCNRPRNDLFYNEDALDLQNKIYVTEGPFDALTCGPEGIANCTKIISKVNLLKLINCKAESIFFIPDTGEYYNWLSVALKVSEYKYCYIVNLENYNGKDINEVGLSKVGFTEVSYSSIAI